MARRCSQLHLAGGRGAAAGGAGGRLRQYPRAWGRPRRRCSLLAAGGQLVTEDHFSCVADGCLVGTAVDQRRQVVVAAPRLTSA
jgi:hypothetical protein